MTDKFKRSLLPEVLRGKVLFFTGQAGAGKTLGSMLDPNNTFFIDADHMKGRVVAEQKPRMKYVPVNSPDRTNLAKSGELFVEAISSINHDKTTVVVLDNLYEIEQALHAYVIANPVQVARWVNKVASKITSRQWGADTLAHEQLLKSIVHEFLAKDITVVINAHMKNRWGAAGQLEIKGRNWVYESASLVGIMIRTGAAPDMLVFKNAFSFHVDIDIDDMTDKQIEQYRNGELVSSKVYQRVPRRIPGFTPSKLFRYLARTPEQIESTPYSQGELFDDDEMAPYMEILTKDQRANVDKMLQMDDDERERAIAFEANMKEVQRVELDQFILDNIDMDIPNLIKTLKTNFQMFAAEINPPYILTVRNRG